MDENKFNDTENQEEGYYIFSVENENTRRLLKEKEAREKAQKKQAEKEKKEAAKRKKKEERKEKLRRAARVAIPVASALVVVAAVVSALFVIRPWRWYISIPDEEIGMGGSFYYIDQRYMYYINQSDNTLYRRDWNWDENHFEDDIHIIDSDVSEFVIGKNGIYYLQETDHGYYDLCHIDFRNRKEVEYLDTGLKGETWLNELNKLKCVQGYDGEDIVYMHYRNDDDESSVIKAYNTKTGDWSLFEVECKYLTSYAFADDMIYYYYRGNDNNYHLEAFDFDYRTGEFSDSGDVEEVEYYHGGGWKPRYVVTADYDEVYTISFDGIYSTRNETPEYFSFSKAKRLYWGDTDTIFYVDRNDNVFVYTAWLKKEADGDFYYDVICDDEMQFAPELEDPDIEGYCKDLIFLTGSDSDGEKRGIVYDINSGDLYLELW